MKEYSTSLYDFFQDLNVEQPAFAEKYPKDFSAHPTKK